MSPPAKSSKDKDKEKDTWNFKSMGDDDPMDFGFEPIAKDKKNAFKMDMSFDLDGDFGNLSSFKMDMPDFDFSSPAKKTTKTKESSDDKSSGSNKKKKNVFGFSYDFNGLDDFNLDPSPPKKGSETKIKAMDHEEIAAGRKNDKSDALDFDLDLSPPKKVSETKIKAMDHEEIAAGRKNAKSDALDFDLDLSPPKKVSETKTKAMDRGDIAAGRKSDKSDALDFGLDLAMTRQVASKARTDVKASALADTENQISNATDTMVVDKSTESKQATLESSENSWALESPQSPRLNSPKTHMMHLQPQSVNTSPSKSSGPMVEELDEPCLSNETAASSPLHASEATHTALNREISPDMDEICRSGTKEDCPGDPENAHNEIISTTESTQEKLESNSSSQLCLEKTEEQEKMGTDTQAEIQDQTRRLICDPDIGHSRENLSGKISPDSRPSQTAKVQDSSAKLPLAPSHSPMETDTQADTVDQSRRTVRDPDAGHPQTAILGETPPDSRLSRTFEMQDLRANLQLDPSKSGPDLSDLKVTKTKHSGLIRSRFFRKPEKPEPQVLESSPARTESRPVNRERKELILNSTDDKSSGIQDAIPGSGTRRVPLEPVNTNSENNAENVNSSSSSHEKKIIHKDQSNVKTAEHLAGQLDRSKMQAKNTTRERSMLQINISSKLDASSLTQKLSKHLNSGVESVQRSKIVPLERPKLGKSMSDLRAAMKTQRTIGVNKDPLNSAVQPEVSSSIRKERNTETPVLADMRAAKIQKPVGVNRDQPSSEVQPEVGSSIRTERNTETPVLADVRAPKTQRAIGVNKDQPSSSIPPEAISSIRKERNTGTPLKKISVMRQLAPRDKSQTLHFPSSLKRKTPDEDAGKSLMPQLKRVSMSPRENRNVEQLTHRLAQGKFSIQESRTESNTAKELANGSPRIKSHHQNVNMANVEIPITESNDNVEKAEAYTKELENICNILKKKHEEVKELLVRAVVNNNKLLMLNHPLYEEKIRMVQEFAAKLTLNEQQMMQT